MPELNACPPAKTHRTRHVTNLSRPAPTWSLLTERTRIAMRYLTDQLVDVSHTPSQCHGENENASNRRTNQQIAGEPLYHQVR